MCKCPRYSLAYVINDDNNSKGGGIGEGGSPSRDGYLDGGVLRGGNRFPLALKD